MNARTKTGRPNKARPIRTIKIAPATRAIRAALAVSVTMLALAGSDIATAGTCTYSVATNTETCDGAFTTLPGGNFVPVADMTLVLGGNLPTSVTPGIGVTGVIAAWSGNVGVINQGDITTLSADGIYEHGSNSAVLRNYGDINSSVGYGGDTVYVGSIHQVTVVNGGDILAHNSGNFALTDLEVYSRFGSISIDNLAGGTIAATGTSKTYSVVANAFDSISLDNAGTITADGGHYARAVTMSGFYGATIDNSGTVGAVTSLDQYHSAEGFIVRSHRDLSITNSGSIATRGGFASALDLYSLQDVTISNTASGVISVSGAYGADGIALFGHASSVLLDNAGDITVNATLDVNSLNFNVRAMGVYTYKGNDPTVSNEGDIAVVAINNGNHGGATAIGVREYSGVSGHAVVTNSGSITTIANGGDFAGATGVSIDGVLATFNSSAGSSIVATANVHAGGVPGQQAVAIGVDAHGYGALTNVRAGGDIVATATASATNGQAIAEGLLANGSVYFGNSAANVVTLAGSSISADANAHSAIAWGLEAIGKNRLSLNNAGDIDVIATGYSGMATGLYGTSGGDVVAGNSGDINAEFVGIVGTAYGAHMHSTGGDVTFINSGDITVLGSYAIGIDAYAAGLLSVTNVDTGSVTATGWSGAIGLAAVGNAGASVSNSGAISATTYSGLAWGVQAVARYGAATVNNAGDISAVGNIGAIGGSNWTGVRGIYAEGYAGATVVNSGDVSAEGTWADGICANACYGNRHGASSVTNTATGHISVTGLRHATGVAVYGESGISVYNSGDISATASYGFAIGIDARALNVSTIINSASGNIVVNGAYGVDNNHGFGGYGITGIRAFLGGESTISNYGDIAVTAVSAASHSNVSVIANGVLDYFSDSALVNNGGSINVTAANDPNSPGSYNGEDVVANGIIVFANSDAALVDNSGSIAVTANNSPGNYIFFGDATATGVRAASVSNSGNISVAANGIGRADATGISAINFVGSAGSSIDVSASANSVAFATGVFSYSSIDAGGTITVSASGDPDWSSFAVANGLSIFGTDSASITTEVGSLVNVTANAPGAHATGLLAMLDRHVAIENAGDINAHASGGYGQSIGISVESYDDAAIFNSGDITAEFGGADGSAYGALITSIGDATFTNTGDITAINTDRAVGIALSSASNTTLINSGTITAIATNTGGIAVLTGNAADTIDNSGTINGEVWTGAAGDTFANGADGLWHAIGSSGFGDGDDVVSNAGTIFLDNAAIFMGSSDTGDQFNNTGLIFVAGDSSIDMGTGPASDSDTVTIASVPSLNPNAFVNDGIISFVDGATNDTLTITGDFAGDGVINMDVSALNNASDLLYIDGSVVDGSINTINVNLVGAPTSASSEISLVRVSGDSTAGDFVLGGISFTTNPFLTQDFSLASHIDASNATDDVFSLDIEVTGLSAPGALAASIAPGAQSLLNSQVGTWRQRMGVIDKTIQGKPSLWARTFQDSGTIAPDAVAGNFGAGGNLAFDQRNSGTEVGADFALSDKLSVGVLLAKVDANQTLRGAGADKLNGNSRGLYATWISPSGFYLDASYRWMDFDARLSLAAGEVQSHGEADALNLEMGYAWTLASGMKIEPQFQHTRTTVSAVDAFSIGSSTFHSKGGDSSRDRLGLMVRKSFASNGTVWTPYASINAVHMSDGESAYSVDNTFFGATSAGGTSALIEGGLSVQIGHLSIFGSANWQDGGALQSFSGGQMGLRYNW